MEKSQASRITMKSKIPQSKVLARRRRTLPPNSGIQEPITKAVNKETCPLKTKSTSVRQKPANKENVQPACKGLDKTGKSYRRRSKSSENLSTYLKTHKKLNVMSYRELMRHCETLNDEVSSMQQTMGDMLDRISALQKDRQDLSSQLDMCKSDLQESTASCSTLEEHNDALKHEVAECRTLLESNCFDVLSGQPIAMSDDNIRAKEDTETNIQTLAAVFRSVCEVAENHIDSIAETTKEIHMQTMKWSE